MRDKFGSHIFANQAGEVGSNDFHPALEVALNFSPELVHLESLLAKILQACNIEVTDFLSHRVLGSVKDTFRELSIGGFFLDFFESGSSGGSISNEMDQLYENEVVWNDPGELGEMPRIPFFDAHGKSVDILVEQFEQTDRLNDGLILPVHVQRNLVAREGVGQTQSRLFQLNVLKLVMLKEL